ncbi:putative neutral sphingomyelinase isoform X2 [Bombyx mori]|uniref:sphingomyelin phosphodiesterase n=1 Tax=Bombyx mori TaxID=7091 RepID=A0A8R1WKQ0_BOMMO|nr:putative neutral sphingomyelinase isoform X2 [Bombyx mori]
MEFTLNIFTLNCWGIPVVSKNKKERYEAISTYLLKSEHNIVCLQEVWSEKDYLYLKENLKNVLPYSYYFYSGVLGSGLCVFSKWVIQDVFFHQWPLNGYIHKIHHGDWFGGKGVGLCRIKFGERLINVYCTHLHAEYHEDDMYLAHRVLQAYSTAEFVKLTSSPADVSILAGDLNTAPGDLSYKIISQLPSLLDPYNMKFEGTNPLIAKASGTSDNLNNSYSDPKQVKAYPEGKRIDHILFHTNHSWEARVVNFGNPLPDRVPEQQFSYSDHNAVSLELHLKPCEQKLNQRQESVDSAFQETITQAIKVCRDATTNLSKSKKLYLLSGGLIFMFLLGSVGFWPNFLIYDVLKLLITALCFYNLVMGSLWNQIEMNSLKAGLNALENFIQTRNDTKPEDINKEDVKNK